MSRLPLSRLSLEPLEDRFTPTQGGGLLGILPAALSLPGNVQLDLPRGLAVRAEVGIDLRLSSLLRNGVNLQIDLRLPVLGSVGIGVDTGKTPGLEVTVPSTPQLPSLPDVDPDVDLGTNPALPSTPPPRLTTPPTIPLPVGTSGQGPQVIPAPVTPVPLTVLTSPLTMPASGGSAPGDFLGDVLTREEEPLTPVLSEPRTTPPGTLALSGDEPAGPGPLRLTFPASGGSGGEQSPETPPDEEADLGWIDLLAPATPNDEPTFESLRPETDLEESQDRMSVPLWLAALVVASTAAASWAAQRRGQQDVAVTPGMGRDLAPTCMPT